MIRKVVVAGGGVLGSQIAFQSAYCGFDVTIWLRSEGSIGRTQPKLDHLHQVYIDTINLMATPDGQTPANWANGIADFDALEEQVVLMKLMSSLSETTQSDGVGVAIGSETHTPGLLHASVVTSGYGRTSATADDVTKGETAEEQGRETSNHTTAAQDSTEPIAFVGSIGPTHMDYAATMAAVRAVARYLTAFVAHDENQNNS